MSGDPSPAEIRSGIDRATRNWRAYWQPVVAGLCEHTEMSRVEALLFLNLMTATETHRRNQNFFTYVTQTIENEGDGDLFGGTS